MDSLSVTASIIAIVRAISSTYEAIQHLRGLPKEFSEVYRALLVTQNSLVYGRELLQTGDDTLKEAIRLILIGCEEKAKKLQAIFEDVKGAGDNSQNSSVLDLYRTSLLRLGKSHRVETLMKDIVRNLETLSTNRVFKTASQRQIIELKEAVERLSKVESSVTDADLDKLSPIFNQTVAAKGNASQHHYSGHDHTINSGSTFHNYGSGVNVYHGIPPLDDSLSGDLVRLIGRLPFLSQRNANAISLELPKGLPIRYIPFRQVQEFTGRQATLTRLKTLLFEDGRERVALVGLGGIGKTQVALHLAEWVKQNKQSYSIIWLSCHSRAGFEKSCTDVLKEISVSYTADEDPKALLQQLLSSEKAERWLLVVDNADDIDLIRGDSGPEKGILHFLPRNDDGHILITTQSQDVAVIMAGQAVVELRELDLKEGRLLLEQLLIDQSQLENEELVKAFLEKLVYHPLAISQATAYINKNMDFDIKDYLLVFEATAEDATELLSNSNPDTAHTGKIRSAVATTWAVSFTKIHKTNPLAGRLLSFIKWIEPNAIPKQILPEQDSKLALTDAVGLLCRYKFLQKQEGREVYDMHSLVHLVLGAWAEEDQDMSREAAFEQLCSKFGTDDWEERETWRAVLPHVLRALQVAQGVEDDDYCNLEYWAARCEMVDGHVQRALGLLKHVVAVQERSLAEDHPSRLASQHALALAYLANGQVKEAVKLLEHVAAVKEKLLAEDHPDRLASQHALAGAYRANGQVKKAVELLKYVVSVRDKSLAEDHPSRLASQHALALAYEANGQVKEAVQLLERVLEVRQTLLTEDHPDRLTSQHALAGAYQANGEVKEAVKQLEHVVAVREKSLAEDHPDRLASQHALALAYQANGQVKKAVQLLEQVVAVEEKSLSDDHPDRLVSQHALALAYRANGKVKEAVELLEHVVAVRDKSLAEDHPSRLASQHALAGAYQVNGQVKEATRLLEYVVAVEEKSLSDDHPDRLASQHALALAYRANGQVKEAVELLEHVVAVRDKSLAEDHPSRLASQHALAGAYRDNKKVKQSVELLEHVVAVREKSLSEDHPSRLASQHALAGAYQASGQVKEAVKQLEHVVAVRDTSLAEDHPDRLASQHALAAAYEAERYGPFKALQGHSDSVVSVVFSPNSKQLVSGSHDRTVKIWDAISTSCTATLKGHSNSVNAVVFSSDSAQVASASSDRTVKVWDAITGVCLLTLEGHSDSVKSVAFSADSKQLASASDDQTVKIWDAATGACTATLEGHSDGVNSVVFSPKSTVLASASDDTTAKVWEAVTGKCLLTLGSHSDSVKSIAFSADSKQLSSASSDRTVKIWNALTGKCISTFEGHSGWVHSVGFSPGLHDHPSPSDDGAVKVWDLKNGTCTAKTDGFGGYVNAVSLSPDSKLLAAASNDATIRIFHAVSEPIARGDHDRGEDREGGRERAAVLLADVDTQSDTSDVSYVSSVFTYSSCTTDNSKTSARPSETLSAAAKILAHNLFGDKSIHPLYLRCFLKFGPSRFSKDHDKLLKIFMKDLLQAATEPGLYRTAKLLGKRRARALVTTQLLELLQAKSHQFQYNWTSLEKYLDQQEDIDDRLNAFLLDQPLEDITVKQQTLQPTGSSQALPARVLEEPDDSGDDKEDEDEEEADEDDEDGDEVEEDEEDKEYGVNDKEGIIVTTSSDNLEGLVKFALIGTPFNNFKSNLNCFANPPTTVSAALEMGNARALRRLLRRKFDSIACGEYSWLRELEELGQTHDEIADLLLEDASDSPWIYFTPAPEPDPHSGILLDHHVPGCVHRLLEPPDRVLESQPTTNPEQFSVVLEKVQRLCGFAGITPSSREPEQWNGSVNFEEDNSLALVSYKHPDIDVIIFRIMHCLELLCSAVSRSQLAGLCCHSFTILRQPASGFSKWRGTEPIIEACSVEFSLLMQMLKDIRLFSQTQDLGYADTAAAVKLLERLFPEIGFHHVRSDITAFLQICSLSAQLLVSGFQSYLQAHVGSFHPFFLDTPIEKGTLLGCHDPSQRRGCIHFEMKHLTCMEEMLQDRVLVFSGVPFLESPFLENSESTRFDLLTNAEDLIDTWGPGQFIVSELNGALPSAIRIGGGVVFCSHPERHTFHWSRKASHEQLFKGKLDPLDKIRIGSLVTVNNKCKLDEEQCRARCVPMLRQLGTHPPGYALAERQIGIQGGQYLMLQANAAYHRYPGRTLKQFRLEQEDEQLFPFLEENWAVQVSLCTGIARRLPLRVMVADLLPIFANSLTSADDWSHWEILRAKYHVLEAFRDSNLQDWLRKLEAPLHKLVIQVTRRILQLLSETGLDRSGKSFVISWPYGTDTYRGFYIDLRKKESSWVQLIADSEDCATFAYVSTSCLETADVRCQGTHSGWQNAIRLLETSVLRCPTGKAPLKAGICQLKHEDICFFKIAGNVHFVKVKRPSSATFAKLVQQSNNIPQKIKQRLYAREKSSMRLRERNGVQEGGEEVALLTLSD